MARIFWETLRKRQQAINRRSAKHLSPKALIIWMDQFIQEPKLSAQLKQTSKGFWYVYSFTINANDTSEFELIFDNAMKKLEEKLRYLNGNSGKNNKTEAEKSNELIILNPEEEKLFQRLKQIRIELAMKEGFPPYVVFHDSVLKTLARQKPKTAQEMIRIIGEKKFTRYGEIFLNAFLDYYKLESQKL